MHKIAKLKEPSVEHETEGSRTGRLQIIKTYAHTLGFEFPTVLSDIRAGATFSIHGVVARRSITNESQTNWNDITETGDDGRINVRKRTFIASFRAGSTVARSARAISSSFLHSFCSSAIRCDRAATVLCVSSASRL